MVIFYIYNRNIFTWFTWFRRYQIIWFTFFWMIPLNGWNFTTYCICRISWISWKYRLICTWDLITIFINRNNLTIWIINYSFFNIARNYRSFCNAFIFCVIAINSFIRYFTIIFLFTWLKFPVSIIFTIFYSITSYLINCFSFTPI